MKKGAVHLLLILMVILVMVVLVGVSVFAGERFRFRGGGRSLEHIGLPSSAVEPPKDEPPPNPSPVVYYTPTPTFECSWWDFWCFHVPDY